ncbi:NUDIX hydrolase [Polymorphospora rubra]|uniref:NUDIX hydrolase n=1 Tax=Polymorphospora rubra TaxID=338584 RepID=A0A810NFC0_9ACTN|nr:NUDIX domain-containing protein [Polymorphospora rubra]BCJ70143.1 NUDIX hydrolase [Polymorphospora rubra]
MPVSPYVAGLRAHVGHELLLLPGASAVVRDDRGRILLCRRSDDGTWGLPAGAIDPGEQPADAVLREIFEETGVVAEVERVGGVGTHRVVYPNGDVCEYLTVWFRCRAVGGEARVNDDESLEVAWFDPADLPALNPRTRLRVDTTVAAEGPAWFARPGEHGTVPDRPAS